MPICIERPYAYVISTNNRHQYCSFCLADAGSSLLQRCSKCQFAHYCNASCQRSAWKVHRLECACLAKVKPRIPTDSVRLMARIIFKQKSSGGRDNPENPWISTPEHGAVRRSLADLVSHSTEIRQDPLRSEHFANVCLVLGEYLDEEHVLPASELLELFGKVSVNCFSICNKDLTPIGVGLFLNLSLLDHSCQPDAVVVFDGPNAILNQVNPQSSGVPFSELRVSYVEILSLAEERNSQLKEQYYFECSCYRCKDTRMEQLMLSLSCTTSQEQQCPGAVLISEDKMIAVCEKCGSVSSSAQVDEAIMAMQHLKWRLQRCDDLSKGEKPEDRSSRYQLAVQLLKEQTKQLHALNIYRIRALDHAFDASIDMEKWPQAVEYGMDTIYGYRTYYSHNHPSLGVQLMKIGKILLWLSRLTEADVMLKQAERTLRVSHGTKHSLYQELLELINSCNAELHMTTTTASTQQCSIAETE